MVKKRIVKFQIAEDAINPQLVPYKQCYSGAKIPCIGLGTFGSDHITAKEIACAVKEAIALGYRHIDCASVYGNEAEIGKVLQEIFSSGFIKREDLWITSKVWNDRHGQGDVLVSCAQSLKDLQLDYLDLYLVHWPFPNFHPPGCDVTSRNELAKPYIHNNYMKTWRQMERLVETGLVNHIGTSNMTIPKLKLLLADAKIFPACNEMELHPHFQQPEMFEYVRQNNIVPIAYSPLGSPGRPERDRTIEDTVDITDPLIVSLSNKYGVHPAAICLKWAIKRGQIPIPFSTNRKNMRSNLEAATSTPLLDEELNQISAIDKNCRLIKGQVFLWKDNQDWQDLWDIAGTPRNLELTELGS